MTSNKELCDSLRISLEERGVLPAIKSQLRQEILKSLNNDPSKHPSSKEESEDNFLINELIKEYCSWNGYLHTSKVISEESGHPSVDLSRSQLEASFEVESGPNSRRIPLLYSLLTLIKK
uniref:LisH domain-containing protein C16orf63 homolog n=1 Tax=Caligus clemensi TaxID=344056 RepID=C1C2V2_CALCM|nr:LisH domain-containing protein C16orf63 homolog [Caligus clemensi]